MKKMLFLMVALLAVFSITTGAFAAQSVDNESVAMTLDWDEADSTLTLYEQDNSTEITTSAMTLVKSSSFNLGDNKKYVAGLIYAEVGGGAQPWKLAVVIEGDNEGSNLEHSTNPLKTLAFKVDCENAAAEDTEITTAWTAGTGYLYMKPENANNDGTGNIFTTARASDLAGATMIWYGASYMNSHARIPFSFGVGLGGEDLIGGTYERSVKFLLYYD